MARASLVLAIHATGINPCDNVVNQPIRGEVIRRNGSTSKRTETNIYGHGMHHPRTFRLINIYMYIYINTTVNRVKLYHKRLQKAIPGRQQGAASTCELILHHVSVQRKTPAKEYFALKMRFDKCRKMGFG